MVRGSPETDLGVWSRGGGAERSRTIVWGFQNIQ